MESAAVLSMQPPEVHQTYGRRSKRPCPESDVEGKSKSRPLTRANVLSMQSSEVRRTYRRRFKRACPGDVEGKAVSRPLTRANRSVSINKGRCQNQDDSVLGKVSTVQSVEARKLSSQPVQPGKPFPEAEARELRTLDDRGYMFQEVEQIMRTTKIKLKDSQITELKERLGKVLDVLHKANEAEIDKLRIDCGSLRQENSVLKNDNKVFRKRNEELNSRYETLSSDNCRSLLEEISLLKKDKEVLKKTNEEVNLKYKHNRICGSYADGEATPKLLINDLPTTRAAVTAFQRELFECVNARSKLSPWELLDCNPPGDGLFARPEHSKHYFRSAVNRVFYEGFENVGFNTMRGVSRFLDPKLRCKRFYEYYLREKHLLERDQKSEDDNEDLAAFEEFCQMKVCSLLGKMQPACNRDRELAVSYLEKLGGPVDLVSNFKSTAKAVWLLHKLAFSFEPPATVFRVKHGADFDRTYMESRIVELDDDERLEPKVGFMIDPGLCLPGVDIMRSDVYLSLRVT